MIGYSFILLIILIGVVTYDLGNVQFFRKPFLILCLFLLTLLSGFRYRVGGDALSYEDSYEYIPSLVEIFSNFDINFLLAKYQPLWLFFVSLIKTLFHDYYYWQFFHALCLNVSLYIILRRYTRYYFTCLLLIYLFLIYFYFSFEIQRECLAICIGLLNYNNLNHRKYLRYYIGIVIAFLFHFSAIILLFVPLLRKISFTKLQVLILSACGFVLILIKPFLVSIFSFLMVSESLQSLYSYYTLKELSFSGYLFHYLIRVVLFIPYILIRKKGFCKKYLWIIYSYLIINILSLIFIGFERFNNYLLLFLIIDFTNFIYSKYFKSLNLLFRLQVKVFFLCTLFFILPFKIVLGGSDGYVNVFFPYESIFSPHKNSKREYYFYHLWD